MDRVALGLLGILSFIVNNPKGAFKTCCCFGAFQMQNISINEQTKREVVSHEVVHLKIQTLTLTRPLIQKTNPPRMTFYKRRNLIELVFC